MLHCIKIIPKQTKIRNPKKDLPFIDISRYPNTVFVYEGIDCTKPNRRLPSSVSVVPAVVLPAIECLELVIYREPECTEACKRKHSQPGIVSWFSSLPG